METRDTCPPSPREAREALQQLASDEDAVRYPPLSRWFFVAMAAAVALLYLAQLLPASDASNATIALGAVTAVLGSRYWLNRDGVSWASVRLADIVPFMAAILGSFAVCWAVAAATGSRWIWVAGAVVAGGMVALTGRRYRKVFGDDA